MSVTITNVQEERAFESYKAARNVPRNTMAYGVYPNCKKSLAEYSALVARLSEGGDLATFAEYHATATAPVAAYIAQLQTAMQAICTIMEAVDAAAIQQTGGPVFGIPQSPEEGQI